MRLPGHQNRGQPVVGSKGQDGEEEKTDRGSGDKHLCDKDLGDMDFYW